MNQRSVHRPEMMAKVLVCRPEEIDDPLLLEQYREMLNDDERARSAQFRFESDSHTFVVAHALVRAALSHMTNIPLADWKFRVNAFGRPEVEGPDAGRELRFNLSHCRGLAAVFVCKGGCPGIDVEQLRFFDDMRPVAASVLSSEELEPMRMMSDASCIDHFFSLWTLKEAYSKGRGLGISLDFRCLSFRISGKCIEASFGPKIEDHPDRWSFTLMRPTPSHFLATALHPEVGGVSHSIAAHWFVPLIGIQEAIAPGLIASSGPLLSQHDQ